MECFQSELALSHTKDNQAIYLKLTSSRAAEYNVQIHMEEALPADGFVILCSQLCNSGRSAQPNPKLPLQPQHYNLVHAHHPADWMMEEQKLDESAYLCSFSCRERNRLALSLRSNLRIPGTLKWYYTKHYHQFILSLTELCSFYLSFNLCLCSSLGWCPRIPVSGWLLSLAASYGATLVCRDQNPSYLQWEDDRLSHWNVPTGFSNLQLDVCRTKNKKGFFSILWLHKFV